MFRCHFCRYTNIPLEDMAYTTPQGAGICIPCLRANASDNKGAINERTYRTNTLGPRIRNQIEEILSNF